MRKITPWILTIALITALPVAASETASAPTVAEQMASLEKMCNDSQEARSQRQTDKALYLRLGGYGRISQLTTEIVRLHNENDAIRHMFTHVDSAKLAKHVADFVAAGTGGKEVYSGRDMPTTHATLHLTDADFLSAGGDIIAAMQSLGYGQEEIDEVVCILVSLKSQVVFK